MEHMQRQAKRRQTIRRSVIIAVVAIVVVGSAALLFSGKSSPTTTTTTSTTASSSPTTTVATSTGASTTTTTTTASAFAPVGDPSPAGKFGTAPTVIVPTTAAPTKLEVSDLIKGTGTTATDGRTLEVQYVLATYSSHKVVQSSWTSSPFSFQLGVGAVIKGWDEGMLGMRVGGRREMIIPPSLGYKNVAQGPGITANDTLVFVVDLLKVS
jgi:peptidylprolyl isomerase